MLLPQAVINATYREDRISQRKVQRMVGVKTVRSKCLCFRFEQGGAFDVELEEFLKPMAINGLVANTN
jgi:hypothetical protein